MKKHYYFLLLLTGLVLLYCCKRDLVSHSSEEKNEITIKSAKAILEENAQKFDGEELLVNIKNNRSSNSFLANGEVKWNAKISYILSGQQNIEVPFFTNRNTITLYNFRKLMYEETEPDRILRASYSYTNILFNKSKSTGINQATLVTYIPDRGAIEDLKYNKTGQRMTLNELDSEFSGYIEYKTLKNEVTSVYYVERGVLKKRYSLRPSENTVQSFTTSTTTCKTVCTPVYQTVCVSAPERGDGAEVCTQKYMGEKCVEECTTTPDDPENPNPGGGTPSQPAYPAAQVQAFIANVFIPCPNMGAGTEARIKFESELTGLLSGNYGESFSCFTERMLQYLSSQASTSGVKIALCVDAGTNQAGYSPINKTLSFHDAFNINPVNIFHEIFHAAQDRIYQSGITQYLGDQGKAEIEFETHLFIDLVGRISSVPPVALYDNANFEYRSFLNGLIKDSNGNTNLYNAKNYFTDVTAQTPSYVYYKDKFKQRYPSYATPNYNIGPQAIQYFLNHFNCYL